jgi:aminopeptidase N
MAQVDRAPPRAYARSVYIGGACALRALASRLGQRRLDAILRGLAARHRYGVITGADFLAAFRAADPAATRAFARRIRRG